MRNERRSARRAPARVFFNKYIDGHAHLAEAISISTTGMLSRRVHEPAGLRAEYAVEIALPDAAGEPRIWVCASPVWADEDHEALVFVDSSDLDRALLERLVARLAA